MELNLRTVINKLERLRCSTHGKHPVVQINGSNFKFECCCENFSKKCIDESHKLLAEEGKRAITESLNKALKGLK